MRFQVVLGAMLLLSGAFPLFASQGNAASLDEIRAQQAEIRADARAGRGIYENLSEAQRGELFAKQDLVLRLIDGKQASSELSEPQRLQLFNQLESIEALVNHAEDQRVVCERVATIGTNRKTRICKTVAQRREDMRTAQDVLNRRSNCSDCGGD